MTINELFLGLWKMAWAWIPTLMELLKEVVTEARKTGTEDIWMLNYILAELPYVFRKEGDDVPVQQMRADVRLP